MLIGISSVIFNVHSNITLKKSFKLKEDAYPYKEAVKNLDIDLDEISEMLIRTYAPVGHNYVEKITSPISVSYYKSIHDRTPVYTINKGDIIDFKYAEFAPYNTSYRGLKSLPTTKQGWRLVKPFKIKGKRTNNDLLFVKLSDLKVLCATWLDKNPKAITPTSRDIKWILFPKKEYVNVIVLYLDRLLYEKGVYISPDLCRPIFSVLTCLSFAISFVIIILYLFVYKFHARRLLLVKEI